MEDLWEAFSAGVESTGAVADDMSRYDFESWLVQRDSVG